MSTEFAGLNGPYCHNCRRDRDQHAADKKCLWGPTYFEPVIHIRLWKMEGCKALWLCPYCNGSNELDGLTPNDVVETTTTCVKCQQSIRVLG
jgi:hypothetical protein